MNTSENFAKNLRTLRSIRHMSLCEFSEELDIPKSTLQTIMGTGNTSLDTACRISNALGTPLSILTDGALLPEHAELLHGALLTLELYRDLSPNEQMQIRLAVNIFLEIFQK